MDSSENPIKIEQSSHEYKADLLIVAALHKEKKWAQKVFDVDGEILKERV